MLWIPPLRQRRRLPELMDQPDLDAGHHLHALRGLERINRWSGSSRILWPPIRALAQDHGNRPLRLLDVASGGGDVPLRLWRQARKSGLPLQIEGGDISPRAVAHARQRAEQLGAEVRFFPLDALNGDLPAGYDVITCSLLLHHLDEDQARELLRRLAGAAGRLALIHDLRRSLAGFLLAYLGTRVLSTSHVVHFDGPVSVAAAFTLEEARQLAEQAGLIGAVVQKRWPCRFLLSWRRP
jgi:SAM-dependent methyltransferase